MQLQPALMLAQKVAASGASGDVGQRGARNTPAVHQLARGGYQPFSLARSRDRGGLLPGTQNDHDSVTFGED